MPSLFWFINKDKLIVKRVLIGSRQEMKILFQELLSVLHSSISHDHLNFGTLHFGALMHPGS